MRNIAYFKDKCITVVGCARSGVACARLLVSCGAKVFVTDNQDTPDLRSNMQQLVSLGVRVELGRHTLSETRASDMVVVSPGVSNTSPVMLWAAESGVLVVSEIEVAAMLCPARIVAVTGSNGKTTVTTLIGKVLGAAGKKVCVCGNIGTPFSQYVAGLSQEDFVVLEVSSFQLQKTRLFKPLVAVMLNVTCNHLDWHKDMQEYFAAKKQIFRNQDEHDFLVVNAHDPLLLEAVKEAKSQAVYFSRTDRYDPNQAAVVAATSVLGIPESVCRGVFAQFEGVEHRMERVATIAGVAFINDSKSTTVEATIWALENLICPVILIAGGKHKGLDYSIIRSLVHRKVKALILIGAARQKIREALQDGLAIEEAESLAQAVERAFAKAAPGDCVLLSPMCSSYDMFRDYEERGRVFKATVRDLAVAHSKST